MREYLHAEQLAEVTPWSVDAIEKMVRRGTLKRGVHWFQPLGRGTKKLFKWTTIMALIEGAGREEASTPEPPVRRHARSVANEQRIDIDGCKAALCGLVD